MLLDGTDRHHSADPETELKKSEEQKKKKKKKRGNRKKKKNRKFKLVMSS
jgi:hypothetical protein